jgi:hypothetical protein
LKPVRQFPSALADHGKREDVLRELRLSILKYTEHPLRVPIVCEGLVIPTRHEVIDADEVESGVGASRQSLAGREEGIVHGSEPLLSVKHYMLGPLWTLVAIDRLARQARKVCRLALPEQQAPDIVIAKDRAHQFQDVPRIPLELALEIGNDEAPFSQPPNESIQANVIGLLRVSHCGPLWVSCSASSERRLFLTGLCRREASCRTM